MMNVFCIFAKKKDMKHLISFFLLFLLACISCHKKPVPTPIFTVYEPFRDYSVYPEYTEWGEKINNSNDSVWDSEQCLAYGPGDTMYTPHNKVYPETITIAYTRDGEFIDSIQVERIPSFGKYIEQGYYYLYSLQSVVGDQVIYDRQGHFLEFICVPEPHSGQGHHDFKP